MRLVERVVLRRLHVLPELLRDGLGDCVFGTAREELPLERRHERVDLLPDCLSKSLGFCRGEPGELLRDLHVLLLVDADRVCRPGDLLEARVEERHGLAAVLAGRVGGDVPHRAGPVEGDERDEVLELRRLDLAQGLAHARRLELEHARGLPASQHRVRLGVVERDSGDIEAAPARRANEIDRLVDHVEVAQTEEVHLQEAEIDHVVHADLRHDLRVRSLLLQRHDLDQRLRPDDDAGSVDRVRSRQALERLRELDDLLRHRVGVDRLPELGPTLESIFQGLARAFRHELRDPVDDAVGDVEHAAGIPDRRSRRHGREGDDLGHAVPAVLLRDVVDDPIAPRDGEVDVHVGEVLARRVQEPLEEQPVAQRVDVRDLEAVRSQRSGGRPAAGADADPVRLREVDEVPHDQEVVREAHLLDGLELEAKALGQLGGHGPIALDETSLAELDEVVERIPSVRHRVARQQDPAELDLDVAPLRDLERASEGVVEPREVESHLFG